LEKKEGRKPGRFPFWNAEAESQSGDVPGIMASTTFGDLYDAVSVLWSWRWPVADEHQTEMTMVDLSISGGKLLLDVRGADKLWALKSSLEIPLEHIAGIRADPGVAHGWWHGWKLAGTDIPGVITAGAFYQHGQRIFWDVHDPDSTVVIELHDERYAELIVGVADPNAAVDFVRSALPGR
jgi:hypothetical protein